MRFLLVKRRVQGRAGLDGRVAADPGVSIPPDAENCHRPAGLALFAAGEEKISVASPTEVGYFDVGGGHAGGSKLVPSHGHLSGVPHSKRSLIQITNFFWARDDFSCSQLATRH